jgi:DNA repair exonuclease SbcCD ATPase subunit
MTAMAQNPSTFNPFCACGCGASVKPGQRWREPACKARVYRARQRADQEELRQEIWDRVDLYLQLEEERDNLAGNLEEVEQAYRQLEQAYHDFRQKHQACQAAPRLNAPQRSWSGDAYAVLGVRADAELEAIEGAYKALVKKYHSDRHPDDPVMDARIKAINAAHDEVLRLRGGRRKRG